MFITSSFVIIVYLFLYVDGEIHFSNWTDCSTQEDCYRRRDLICNNETIRGISCTQEIGIFEEILSLQCNGTNCTQENLEDESIWNNQTITQCQGFCYDSTMVSTQVCVEEENCHFRQRIRCYNQTTCTGIWKTNMTDCSTSCGGGWKMKLITCVNETSEQDSYNCNGTDFGNITQSKLYFHCNNHSCPMWKSSNSCNATCGGGTQPSTCIYNHSQSTLCDESNGESIKYEPCNTNACQFNTECNSTRPIWGCWNLNEWKPNTTRCECLPNEIDFVIAVVIAVIIVIILVILVNAICVIACKKCKSSDSLQSSDKTIHGGSSSAFWRWKEEKSNQESQKDNGNGNDQSKNIYDVVRERPEINGSSRVQTMIPSTQTETTLERQNVSTPQSSSVYTIMTNATPDLKRSSPEHRRNEINDKEVSCDSFESESDVAEESDKVVYATVDPLRKQTVRHFKQTQKNKTKKNLNSPGKKMSELKANNISYEVMQPGVMSGPVYDNLRSEYNDTIPSEN